MFEEILSLRRPRALTADVVKVIKKTVDIALAKANESDNGMRLAAAFDLLASTEYYSAVANRGWTYCNENPEMLLYPYTNTCPRCIGRGVFKFAKLMRRKIEQNHCSG